MKYAILVDFPLGTSPISHLKSAIIRQIFARNLKICAHKFANQRMIRTCVNARTASNLVMIKRLASKIMRIHQRTNRMKFPSIQLSIFLNNSSFMFSMKQILNKNAFFRDCPTGFTKNEDTGKCEDIDECEERTDVTCNIDTQVCLNTPGSYQCLDITPISSICPNGFKFDQKIKQCIGNEIEQISTLDTSKR